MRGSPHVHPVLLAQRVANGKWHAACSGNRVSPQQLVKRLYAIRRSYAPPATREKISLLDALTTRAPRTAHGLRHLHHSLCYLRAFPDSPGVYRRVLTQLAQFDQAVAALSPEHRRRMDGTGAAGTRVYYEFPFHAAQWLSRSFPRAVDIDWSELLDTAPMDSLLTQFLAPAEEEVFDGGPLNTQQWVHLARGALDMTDLDWLMHQADDHKHSRSVLSTLYDEAEVPLRWDLGTSPASITRNQLPTARPAYRSAGMRRVRGSAAVTICRRSPDITRLGPTAGQTVIDCARAALATRERSVHSMTHANSHEVYLAKLGRGVEVAIFGDLPAFRLNLEGNYGYMLFSNGVPVGYGGVSPLFHQANTGISLFNEYRGSEAAYLYVQTLRAFRTLFGCRAFVANPYQFGADNADAINSGAFWFYYRLGFRPVEPDIRKLASVEGARLKAQPHRRSDRKTLRRLAGCDLVLRLRDVKRQQLFPERWLTHCSEGATRLIAAQGYTSRMRAHAHIARSLATRLGVRNWSRWTAPERAGFERLAPIIGLLDDLDAWPRSDKQQLIQLLRGKGGRRELAYARLLLDSDRLRNGLSRYCRRLESDRRPSGT